MLYKWLQISCPGSAEDVLVGPAAKFLTNISDCTECSKLLKELSNVCNCIDYDDII